MTIWQVDFYHLPSQQTQLPRQWELVICPGDREAYSKGNRLFVYTAQCDSRDANPQWLAQQLTIAAQKGQLPTKIQVFRPQALSLLTLAAQQLNIPIEATRHTQTLKQELKQRASKYYPNYEPLKIEQPPPQALPENIWGEEWTFASIEAGEISELFSDRPIPIKDLPTQFLPLNLGIASEIAIPGVVVYGGRKSLILARWLEQQQPVCLTYMPTEVGQSGGLILETGLVDRWIFNTFSDPEFASVAADYEQKKQVSKGLHFLLIQPDNSGMTYTGFWLLMQV